MQKLTRQQAINANCKDCIYDPLSQNGSWLQQVEDCTIESCNLFPYRPLTISTRKKLDDIKLSKLTPLELEQVLERRSKQAERLSKVRTSKQMRR